MARSRSLSSDDDDEEGGYSSMMEAETRNSCRLSIDGMITANLTRTLLTEIDLILESRGPLPPTVFLTIHSKGGSVYEAFRIIAALERLKSKTRLATIINSVAFSVAVPIFCMGHNGLRFASPFAQVMIHQPRLCRTNKDQHHHHHHYHHSHRPHLVETLDSEGPTLQMSSNNDVASPIILGSGPRDIEVDHQEQEGRGLQQQRPSSSKDKCPFNDNDVATDCGSPCDREDQQQKSEARHLEHIKEILNAIMIHSCALPEQRDRLARELAKEHRFKENKNWFLSAQDMVHYGLANYAQLPIVSTRKFICQHEIIRLARSPLVGPFTRGQGDREIVSAIETCHPLP